MKAVILAGGEGSRLGNLTTDVPKPMVKIGPYPIIEHQIRLLKRYGIGKIRLLVGRLWEQIRDYFDDGSKWGVQLSYHLEDKPLGTTGGVKANEDWLTDDFLVLYGDVMMDMDLSAMIAFHRANNASATLMLHPNDHPHDSDLAEMGEDGRIIAFHPKPHPAEKYYHNMVNAALYVLSPIVHKYIEPDIKADFGKHIFPRMVGNEALFGYVSAEYVKDVGTPERLEEVTADLLSGKIARLNRENPRRAVFLDRDGVINKYKGLLHRVEDFELLPDVPGAIRKLNSSEHLAVVVTNQPVVARNLCSMEELGTIHKKMETLLGRQRAKLDAIYFCPHHPDDGYPEENKAYKIDCDCRKPKPGMLKQAEAAFNIDLPNSCMIGDSPRDILCGRNAGVATYAVFGGEPYADDQPQPDGWFDNLAQAVDFIVDEPFSPAFELVRELVEATGKQPVVILIGGNTRTGKSLLANDLRRRFAMEGVESLVVPLDHWLVPASERTPRMELQSARVVIVEGVTALAVPQLLSLAHFKFFMEIDEGELEKRVIAYYQWKGLDKGEIRTLFRTRLEDEYRPVDRTAHLADIVWPAVGKK